MIVPPSPQPAGDPADDPATDHTDENPHTSGSPDMTTETTTSTESAARPDHTRPDQPLYEPLPYGSGFAATEPFGYGVSSQTLPTQPTPSASSAATDVAKRERSGSPVLAVAGLLSVGVAVWAILGAPIFTPTVVLVACLTLTVLVGLAMIIRR